MWFVVDEPDEEVAGVRVSVHEPSVENLLRKNPQNFSVNVRQGHPVVEDSFTITGVRFK